jgi:hypothetical protein
LELASTSLLFSQWLEVIHRVSYFTKKNHFGVLPTIEKFKLGLLKQD